MGQQLWDIFLFSDLNGAKAKYRKLMINFLSTIFFQIDKLRKISDIFEFSEIESISEYVTNLLTILT